MDFPANVFFKGIGMTYLHYIPKINLKLFAETTVPNELKRQAWAKDTWTAAEKDLFWKKFMGKGPNNIIQVYDNLKKEPGDRIRQSLVLKLKGDGVTGDNVLEGNEEKLDYRYFDFTIDQIRNAVRLKGKFEEKTTGEKMRTQAKDALAIWLREKIDNMFFTALTASPTKNRVIYGGTGITAEANITSTAIMTTDLLGQAKRAAQMAYPKIRPIRIQGGSYYVAVLDPFQIRDLRNDEKWINAQQYANLRGLKNPIFTGAMGLYNGVVVHESESVPRTETGSSSAMVGHALLLGAQAGVMANGIDLDWHEKKFDYENQWGVAISRTFGIAQSIFKIDGSTNEDFGVINILTSSAGDGAASA